MSLPVDISGSPVPKVSWTCNGEPVTAGIDVTIETKDNYSKLTVKGVSAKVGAGKYEVKAENKAGSDSAEFTVEIKGKSRVF